MGRHAARLDSILDPATQQRLDGRLFLEFQFRGPGDPAQMEGWVGKQLELAAQQVIAEKLAHNQVAVPTLAQSLPHYAQEIVARAGFEQHGVQVWDLSMQLQLAQPAAPAPAPMGPPAQPPGPPMHQGSGVGQIEVEANLHVGGFNIKASTDGGLDTKGLVDQAKSKVLWWLLFAGLTVLILGGVGIYLYLEISSAVKGGDDTEESDDEDGGKAETTEWDGKEPFSCNGKKNLKIEGVKVKLRGDTAVKVSGGCKLELVDVEIVAEGGVEVVGGTVRIEGGSIEGEKFALKAVGKKSKIVVDGAKIKGAKQAVGGEISDK